MSDKTVVRKLLSKRVQFGSVQNILDSYVPQIAAHFHLDVKQTGELSIALLKIAEHLLRESITAAKMGAERGIGEAIALMQDPDFYETTKKRESHWRERGKEQREQSKKDQEEWTRRRENPTYAEKVADAANAINEMVYHKDKYNEDRKKIRDLVNENGSKALTEVLKKKFPFLDIYSDAFDIDALVESLATRKVGEEAADEDDPTDWSPKRPDYLKLVADENKESESETDTQVSEC